jgi:Domain of unknown function (DUF3362).
LTVAKGDRQRRLHKALLRYHDPANWALIREALVTMGKGHLIGNGPKCLVPTEDSVAKTGRQRRSGRHGTQRFATKHPKQPDIRQPKAHKPKTHKEAGPKAKRRDKRS